MFTYCLRAVFILFMYCLCTVYSLFMSCYREDTFYLYEPLDAVYCSMYGTAAGWNIPADITTHLNGSLR